MASYSNREEAGRVLSRLIPPLPSGAVILAIPNGGVLVGAAVARELSLPLQVIVIRKIQFPWNTESGFGSVASDNSVTYNRELLPYLGLSREAIRDQTEKARRSVAERLRIYGAGREFPELRGKPVILTDDGLASGITMEAAIGVVKKHRPFRILVAVPTASEQAYARIEPLANDLICPDVRGGRVFAVADAYEDWYDVPDEEVKAILAKVAEENDK